MVTVKARKSFYATDHGSVQRGQSIEVSEATAKTMVASGLAEYEADVDGSKDAPKPLNKMQPPSSADPVASTANELGAGGAEPSRASAPKKK
jgi:hypothetical protein